MLEDPFNRTTVECKFIAKIRWSVTGGLLLIELQ